MLENINERSTISCTSFLPLRSRGALTCMWCGWFHPHRQLDEFPGSALNLSRKPGALWSDGGLRGGIPVWNWRVQKSVSRGCPALCDIPSLLLCVIGERTHGFGTAVICGAVVVIRVYPHLFKPADPCRCTSEIWSKLRGPGKARSPPSNLKQTSF